MKPRTVKRPPVRRWRVMRCECTYHRDMWLTVQPDGYVYGMHPTWDRAMQVVQSMAAKDAS